MRRLYKPALCLALACAVLISAMPGETYAFPYKIEGYLKDPNGVPITLANISITGMIYDMNVQDMVPQTHYRTTDEYGYYSIWVAANEPGGYMMNSTVTVSYGTGEDAVSATIKLEGLKAWANLTYEEPVGLGDILMSPVGLLIVIAAITLVLVAYFMLSPRKEEEQESENDDPPKKASRRRRSE